ncbi:hypothetical protein KSC_008270 [Ktedonobacter sp. SOSP1-52]|uniref:DinB family protein n=1 Tax=Ktedonobacter sp. SOSP1-52 TaxID=2778366 RepID=UPI00191566A8|nr:DinB family protein [Ktedonobacter sp. SOSP1-52]GHO61935.1 hypothetical protein KSC_008270 [Ktedonobacter sp. SOSP1-52]
MTEQPSTLAPFYQGWDVYQQHLIKAIAPLTSEQLALRVAPHLRDIDTLVRHIIGARARWSYYVLQIGDERLRTIGEWDRPTQPVRSAAELVSGLEITWQALQNALERWTPADLQEILRDVDEDTQDEETFTRQWVIWHLIEHDMHHGGELSFALGVHQIPAIDL